MQPTTFVAVLAVLVPALLVGTGAAAVRRGRRVPGLGLVLLGLGAGFVLLFVYTALG